MLPSCSWWDTGCGQEPGRKAVIWQAWLPRWALAGCYKKPQARFRVRHKNKAKTFSSSLQSLCIAQFPQMAGLGMGFISSLFSFSFHLPSFSLIASLQKACSKKSRHTFSMSPGCELILSCSYLLAPLGSQAGISAMNDSLFEQEALLTWQG